MNTIDPYRIHNVVMPLVRLIAEGNLSWSDKETCAAAIQASLRHHREMLDEANALAAGGNCGPAQSTQREG
jgi:hypothetical protein